MEFEGGRQLDAQQRLKRFVERERKLRKREAEAAENIIQKESSHNFSKVAFQVLREIINSTSGNPRRQYISALDVFNYREWSGPLSRATLVSSRCLSQQLKHTELDGESRFQDSELCPHVGTAGGQEPVFYQIPRKCHER